MIHRPDFLIVSGNGRNTGKTSFICEVIRKTSISQKLCAIKVSPHFHEKSEQNPLMEDRGYRVWEEHDTNGHKDSSRMLLAGANRVFYIEAKDDALEVALNSLIMKGIFTGPVICESGGMRKWVEPSLFVLLNETGSIETRKSYASLLPLADIVVNFSGKDFEPSPEIIDFDSKSGSWLCAI